MRTSPPRTPFAPRKTPDRKSRRASGLIPTILVRDRRKPIPGGLHHFAFLKALLPAREAAETRRLLEPASAAEDLLDAPVRTPDFSTSEFVDVCERGRPAPVREVHSPATPSIDEQASLSAAVSTSLKHSTLWQRAEVGTGERLRPGRREAPERTVSYMGYYRRNFDNVEVATR